jgi:hypothetical protein
LAVDRRAADPFGDREELILESVAREVDRAIESERIFAAMDQVKYEQERFYDAFSLLNQAISVDGFAGQLIEAVTRIKPVDFVAVTLYEAEAHRHQVVGVKAEATLQKSLEGHPFHDKDGGTGGDGAEERPCAAVCPRSANSRIGPSSSSLGTTKGRPSSRSRSSRCSTAVHRWGP